MSVIASLEGRPGLAIGNALGSSLFNILAVFGLPGVLAPSQLDEGAQARDFPIMILLTIALVVMAYGFKKPGRSNRIEAGILLMCFSAYQVVLYLRVTGTEA